MAFRIAFGGFMHESHSFSPKQTTLADFVAGSYVQGDAIAPLFANTRTEICAFMDRGRAEGWQLLPLVEARATPSGLVQRAAYDEIAGAMLRLLKAALPVNGVLLSLHGAMVSEGRSDPDGDLLAQVRQLVGPSVPVMVTLDLHANVTDLMVSSATAIVGYRTYPHIDQYERGEDAARLLARTLAGQVRPVTVRTAPPLLLTSMNMRTAAGPMATLVKAAEQVLAEPGMLGATVFGGFPYNDCHDLGATIVTVADGSREKAAEAGRRLAQRMWDLRHEFQANLLSPAAAVNTATALLAAKGQKLKADLPGVEPMDGSGPVALVDVTDNPASAGTADTTGLLRAMLEAGLENAAFGTLWDPESVQAAIAAGVGNEADLRIGGKASPQFGLPIPVRARVRTLSDGRFRNKGIMNTGMEMQMGRTAVVQVGGILIVLTEFPIAPYEPEAFRIVGIDPAQLSYLGIKAKNHFRAAFSPLLRAIILVNAPGVATLDLTTIPFKQVRRPIWPLDPDLVWNA